MVDAGRIRDIGQRDVFVRVQTMTESAAPNGDCCGEALVNDRGDGNETKLPITTNNLAENSTSDSRAPGANQQLEGEPKNQRVHVSDLLGEYGNYQLFLTVLTFIRYVCLAMMTNTGPLIAPSLTFWCQLPHELQQTSSTMPQLIARPENSLANQAIAILRNATISESSDNFLKNKCFLEMPGSLNQSYQCTQWTYDRSKNGITLTDEFNLVCDRDWLRSAFQSSISVGVAIASVVFGASSDEHGRRLTMNVCMVFSFLAGLASYRAQSFWIFTLTRSLCTMCDLCIAGSLYTIIVETLGNKYRGIICLIVTTGWSIGVMVMPWVTGYFHNFRDVMLFTVACHVVTIPCLLIVWESPRWLLVNGRIEEVRRQIHSICYSWNRRTKQEMIEIDAKFDLLKLKYSKSELNKNKLNNDRRLTRVIYRTLFGGLSKINELFKSKELLITTLMFIWIIFISELMYMILIFINSDHDDNIKLNYAIGGLMESLATFISIIMISSLSRRLSLSLTLTVISISMIGFAFTYDLPDVSVYTLNITKLAGSSLTSLVFVVITELFPTSLRQTGGGVSGTLGSLGAIIAPFVHNELAKLIGFRNVLLVLCVLPISAALMIPFFLRETGGVDLADDVDEIEAGNKQS